MNGEEIHPDAFLTHQGFQSNCKKGSKETCDFLSSLPRKIHTGGKLASLMNRENDTRSKKSMFVFSR